MPQILSLQLDKVLFRKALEGTYKYERLSADQANYRIDQDENIHESDAFGSLLAAQDSETNRKLT